MRACVYTYKFSFMLKIANTHQRRRMMLRCDGHLQETTHTQKKSIEYSILVADELHVDSKHTEKNYFIFFFASFMMVSGAFFDD